MSEKASVTVNEGIRREYHRLPGNCPELSDKQISRLTMFCEGLEKLCAECEVDLLARNEGTPNVIEIIDRRVPAESPEFPYIAFFEGVDGGGAYHHYDGTPMGRRTAGFRLEDFAGWNA